MASNQSCYRQSAKTGIANQLEVLPTLLVGQTLQQHPFKAKYSQLEVRKASECVAETTQMPKKQGAVPNGATCGTKKLTAGIGAGYYPFRIK